MTKQYDNIIMKRFLYFNVYVIRGIDGDILIDTGFMGNRRALVKWLESFDIKMIILTHAHIDHVWNVKCLKNIYHCDVAMGEYDVEYLDNTKIHSEPVNRFYKYRTKLMNWGMRTFVPEKFSVDIMLKDEQVVNVAGLNLKIVSLQGHTKGSIGVLYKDYLFAGDALVNRKTVTEFAYQNQSNREAKQSALKIIELNPKLVFVGHENVITGEKLKKSQNYILKR